MMNKKKYIIIFGIAIIIGIITVLIFNNTNKYTTIQKYQRQKDEELNKIMSLVYNDDVEKKEAIDIIMLIDNGGDYTYEQFDKEKRLVVDQLYDCDDVKVKSYLTDSAYSYAFDRLKNSKIEYDRKLEEQNKKNMEENKEYIESINQRYKNYEVTSIAGLENENKTITIKTQTTDSNKLEEITAATFATSEKNELVAKDIDTILIICGDNGVIYFKYNSQNDEFEPKINNSKAKN